MHSLHTSYGNLTRYKILLYTQNIEKEKEIQVPVAHM